MIKDFSLGQDFDEGGAPDAPFKALIPTVRLSAISPSAVLSPCMWGHKSMIDAMRHFEKSGMVNILIDGVKTTVLKDTYNVKNWA